MYEKSQVYAKGAFLRAEIQGAKNGQGKDDETIHV